MLVSLSKKKSLILIIHKEANNMGNLFTASLLAALAFAVPPMSVHADEPTQGAQTCDARKVTYLIGRFLTQAVRVRVLRESGATHIVVNPYSPDPEPNRLIVITDGPSITNVLCG